MGGLGRLALTAITFLSALCLPTDAHSCRFWGIVSQHVPGTAINEQLLSEPNSLKNLSYYNADGWAIGYYLDNDSAWSIERSSAPAIVDPRFDTVVIHVAFEHPRIAMAHVRTCSSGLCDIPNPHPFERDIGGRHWLMGHNGTIEKSVLLDLIRPDYFSANPPQYGANIDEWIDSDLYFILMLQAIEDHGYDIKPALGEVIQHLREAIPGDAKKLNFILTDGATLWAYRQGNTLYYTYELGDTAYAAVASQYPSSSPANWVMMEEGRLATLSPSMPPVIENIEDYFGPAAVDDGVGDSASTSRHIILGQNTPNPFNAATAIEYHLPKHEHVRIEIFDILGRVVHMLIDEDKPAGEYRIIWDGAGQNGRPVASGIYV
ncbi:MAG: class II glutamine amidotransferase, partial [candidate division Zixibacteria bacterium]|nr:class II glutamine amidotransferase [candidate division Zixibacteria bacterium]